MTDDNTAAQAYQQAPEPAPDLRALDRLVGTWQQSGNHLTGTTAYEWMEGGHFLLQRFDFTTLDGRKISGTEIIGHERPFGAEPSEDVKSRVYTNTGDTLDYVYELEGDTLTIWGGERGSPAYGAPSAMTATPSVAPGTTPVVVATRRSRPGPVSSATQSATTGIRLPC